MTVTREIPFTCIQFPLYEYMKLKWSTTKNTKETFWSLERCYMWFVAGAQGYDYYPLDVIKTRLMLSNYLIKVTIGDIIKELYREQRYGMSFFKGIGPRTLRIWCWWSCVFGYVCESVIFRTEKDDHKSRTNL